MNKLSKKVEIWPCGIRGVDVKNVVLVGLHCYIHKGDAKRKVNTGEIVKTKDFSKPIEKLKNGTYKMKPGLIYTCFSTDFLIEEADVWRDDIWKMIKERQDSMFLFLTKRIERFIDCIPNDWGGGYDNVIVCSTIENQENADKKLSIFKKLPIKHKQIVAQPLIEKINIEKYLDNIEQVTVGGDHRLPRPVFSGPDRRKSHRDRSVQGYDLYGQLLRLCRKKGTAARRCLECLYEPATRDQASGRSYRKIKVF